MMKTYQQTMFQVSRWFALPLALAVVGLSLPRDAAAALQVQADRTEGSVSYFSDAGGGISITFGAFSGMVPSLQRASVAADQGDAGSALLGDYVAAGHDAVGFLLRTGNATDMARVFLRGGSGRVWSLYFEIESTGGAWQAMNFPLTLDAGWTRNDTDLAAKWAEDLTDVDLIGIELQRGGSGEETYSLASFTVGDEVGTLSPLEEALSLHFNGARSVAELSAADLARDTTGDGVKDWEWLLGAEDLDFFQSEVFWVRTVAVDDDGAITIEWPAAQAGTYEVRRVAVEALGSDNAFGNPVGNVAVAADGENGGRDLSSLPEQALTRFTDDTAEADVNYVYRVFLQQTMGE